ncbi:MAG TPA: hypothetical protein VH082_02290, partial [Rudaea sp.]|nr:hypothetical protein [Rudaea sp.]
MTSTKLLAAALVVGTMTARADETVFCVTTTAELRSALSAASDGGANQDDGTDIFLATGTYSTSDGLGRFFYL